MAKFIVYSAPDDSDNPTIFHNGVVIDNAVDHEDALRQRVDKQYDYNSGSYWISGPSRDDNGAHKLIKMSIRSTAYEIES